MQKYIRLRAKEQGGFVFLYQQQTSGLMPPLPDHWMCPN